MKSTSQLIKQHKSAVERFAKVHTPAFNERAKWLGEQIRREIPALKGFFLAMRSIMTEPRNVTIPLLDESGDASTDTFDNMSIYLPSGRCGEYRLNVSEKCLGYMRELDELINYVDNPTRDTVETVDVSMA